MSKEYKSGYVEWWNRGNLPHTPSKSSKLERQLEGQEKLKGYYYNKEKEVLEPRSDPSPHISSNEKYEHEQATFNPTLGKFVGQKTGREFPDMPSAVTQNKRYDEVEFANRIVDGKEPKKPIHKQLEDLKFYHQGNSEQLNRGKKHSTDIKDYYRRSWGIGDRSKAKEKSTWDVIHENMSPIERGQFNARIRKDMPATAKLAGNIAPSEKKKEVDLPIFDSLRNLEKLKVIEADSEKRAATFRKAMEPIPDEDLYRGLGTFDPRYRKGKA